MTYHSVFSHLLFGSQLWGKTNVISLDKIQKHQNRALRKVLFKKHQDSVSYFYTELKFLNFLTFYTYETVFLSLKLK